MHKKRIVLLCTEPSSAGKADEALPVQRETYRTERGDEFPQSDVSRQSDYRPWNSSRYAMLWLAFT